MPKAILSLVYNSASKLVSTIAADPLNFLFKTVSMGVTKKVTEPWFSEYPANQIYPLPAKLESDVAIKKLPMRVTAVNSAVGFLVGQATGIAVQEVLKLAVPTSTEEEQESIKEISQIAGTLLFTPMITNIATRALGTHNQQLNNDVHNTKKLPFVINILNKQIESLDIEIKKLSNLKKNHKNPAAIDEKLEALREELQDKVDILQAKEALLAKTKNKTTLFGFKN
jgi:hypothetical protein